MQHTITKREPLKPFIRLLAAIAIPVALQNLLTTTASMVDTIMLASLGENTVGAVGLCGQFSSLMFACYWGFVGGGMLFMAQYWGAKDDDGICHSYGLMFTCLALVGVLFAGMAVCAPQLVMRLYTDKQELWPIGISYLRIAGFSYITTIIATSASAMLRSTGDVRTPLIASIASLVTNLVMNYLLIFGKFGLPQMGVRGAAVATLCAGCVNVGIMYLIGSVKKHPYMLKFREHFRWSGAFIREYLIKCFPIICNELLIGVGNMVINIVYGRQSTAAIAAVAVFGVFSGFVVAFFSGFTNAASILVGKEVGAGNHELAFARAKRLFWMTPTVVFTACCVFLCFRRPFLTAMSLTGEAYTIAGNMLLLFTPVAAIRMTNWIQNDTYRSAGDPVFGTVMEITFMYLMVLPCICLTGLVFKLPFLFVFASAYVDEIVRLFIMLNNSQKGRWIKPVTEEGLRTIESFRAAHGIVMKKRKTA